MVQEFFKSVGLEGSHGDPNLFTGNKVFVLLFVDDMLNCGKETTS